MEGRSHRRRARSRDEQLVNGILSQLPTQTIESVPRMATEDGKKLHGLTMCKLLRVRAFMTALGIHVQELRQEPYGWLRADVERLHQRYRKRCQELSEHVARLAREGYTMSPSPTDLDI